MIFSTDAIADFEGLLGSSARKTVQWTVFSENGSADPGGKSRNLQAADVKKGTARCAAVLRGVSLRMHLLPLTSKTCLSLPRSCIIAVDTGTFLWYNFKYIVNNRVMEEEGSTMKATWKRALALLLAVMLALPVVALAGDGGEMLMLPDDVIATEAQDDLALDPDTLDGLEGLDDTSLELDLGGK